MPTKTLNLSQEDIIAAIRTHVGDEFPADATITFKYHPGQAELTPGYCTATITSEVTLGGPPKYTWKPGVRDVEAADAVMDQ